MDLSNSVHLRWNKHQNTLVSVFDALFDTEKLTDCTVSAEGQHLRAHKIILSACSPYFEELFTENYEKHPIVILHNVKYDTVKALMAFMYSGEVEVPQEELSDVLELSESLQVRGLSGSGCVDNVNMQKGSGRNGPPAPPETLPSQPSSVSCFISDQNEPEENVQACSSALSSQEVSSVKVEFRACSPTVSSQEGSSMKVDSISESNQNYRKSVNKCGSGQGTGQNAFEVIASDFDSLHQLSSERQVLPTASNSSDGPVYTPILKTLPLGTHSTISISSSLSASHSLIPRQSLHSELQSSCQEMAVAETEHYLRPEAVLPEKRSANLTSRQHEESLEIKSEVCGSHVEFVEDLTLDDYDDSQNYCGTDDHDDDRNSAEVDIGEFRRVSEGLGNEENFCTPIINSQHSPFGSDYLNNMTLTTSQTVLCNRYSCRLCGKSYRFLKGLQRHRKHECGKEPQFQCPRCNSRCARSDNLKRHMATCHYRDGCNSAKADIEKVRKVNEDITHNENFCSQGINMTLKTSQSVLQNQFSCHSCGMSFQYPQGLRRHMKYQCGK